MHSLNTSLGGQNERFPDTTQGLVSGFRNPNAVNHRALFETLCRRYWKPIYVYVRTAWAKGNEDAKDLTQAFFLCVLEDDLLQGFEPERGSFRRYLKVLLQRFVSHREIALKRLKRGGGTHILSLDEGDGVLEKVLSDPHAADPEKLFDRVWLTEVVNQAVDRVRERARATGQESAFRAFQDYDLAPEGERSTYAALAARLGTNEGEIKKHLLSMREKVRAEIRTELARLTTDDRELDHEWNELLGS